MTLKSIKRKLKQFANIYIYGLIYSKKINSKFDHIHIIFFTDKKDLSFGSRFNLYVLAKLVKNCSVIILDVQISALEKLIFASLNRISFVNTTKDFARFSNHNFYESKSDEMYFFKIHHELELIWRDIYLLFKNLSNHRPKIFYTDQLFSNFSVDVLNHTTLPDWSRIFFGYFDYANVTWGVMLNKRDLTSNLFLMSNQDWVSFLDKNIDSNSTFIHHFRLTPFVFLTINAHINEIPIEFARKRNYVLQQRNNFQNEKASVIIPTALFSTTWFDCPMPTILPLLLNLNYEYSKYDSFNEVVFILSKDNFSRTVLDTLKKISGFPFKIVYQEGDFNFSKKVNSGVEASSNNNLVIINDDISFITRNVIGELSTHLLNPEVGAVGATLLYENGIIQHLGQISYNNIFTHDEQFEKFDPARSKFMYPHEVTGVTGALFATTKRLWQAVGGFDVKLAENFNDTDFMLRLGRNKSIIIDPRIMAFHKENISRPRRVSDYEIEYMVHKHDIPKIDKFFNTTAAHRYIF
jgi:hypothetical protein